MLRDYQRKVVSKIMWANSLPGNDVICVAQGGGKSHIIAEVAKQLNKPVLIVCPNKEVLEQNINKMENLIDREEIGVFSASMNEKTIKKITFGTIQSMYKVPELFRGFGIVIYDECFVAGTKIGQKNIENIIVGDYVDSYNHKTGKVEKKKVTRVIKNELKSQLYLTSCTDSSIISTGNHPILVKGRGYIPVTELKNGDIIYAKQKQPNKTTPMHRVRKDGGVNKLPSILEIQNNWKCISQEVLIHSPWRFNIKNKEIPEQTLLRVIQDEDVRKIEIYRAQAKDSGGEWETIVEGSKETIEMAWRWLEARAYGKKGNSTISLQSGHSSSDKENSHRSRWWGSRISKSKRGGQKKRPTLKEQRVESVEVYQQRNSQKNGKNSDTKTYVYNLEVEDNHNYFANGLLVHNCDLHNPKKVSGMSSKLFKEAGIEKVFGFTGTPFRQDHYYERWGSQKWMVKTITTTKMINRYQGFFWKRMLIVINTDELMRDGYLAPIEYHDMSLMDHRAIPTNKSKSDFDMDRFETMISDRHLELAGKIKNLPHKAKLVFCATIKQAELMASLTPDSEVITSKTTKKKRAIAVKRLKDGDLKILYNVGIYTVGFDYPELDCIVLLRPTRSLRLHCQILGRVTRIAEGKTAGHVYDFVSNVKNMGKLEEIKVEKVPSEKTGKLMWNVTSPAYPTGFHYAPLYSYKLQRKKQ